MRAVTQSFRSASASIEKYQLTPAMSVLLFAFTSALAFADGHFAVGQPIRRRWLCNYYLHEELADKELAVGEGRGSVARSGPLGPALVPDLPAYLGTSLPT